MHEGVLVIQRISITLIHSIHQSVIYTVVAENINNSHSQHTSISGIQSGGGEIATAKRSLECARKWEQSTNVALESARQQLKEAEKNAKDAKDQVRDAELHLKSVEKVCLNYLLHMCIVLLYVYVHMF